MAVTRPYLESVIYCIQFCHCISKLKCDCRSVTAGTSASGFVPAVAESYRGDVFMSGYFETRHNIKPSDWKSWSCGRSDLLTLIISRPPHSHHLTTCDFLLYGYVRREAFVPPLPLDIDEPTFKTTVAMKTTDRTWDKIDYRDLTFVMSRMELTLGTSRAIKTSEYRSKGTSYDNVAITACYNKLKVYQ
jgi:hypothetical protein